MTNKMIIDAYCRIRVIDNTIPDDVLDFMKEAALEKLRKSVCDHQYYDSEQDYVASQCVKCGHPKLVNCINNLKQIK